MEDAVRDDADAAPHRRAAGYAQSLLEKYGPGCQALTEEHLDQAIEQEVVERGELNIFVQVYKNCMDSLPTLV